MLKRLNIQLLLTLIPCFLYGQYSAMDLLTKSNSALNNIDSFSVVVNMKVAIGNINGELLENTTGIYKKQGANSYTELGQLISIQNGNNLLFVNKATQSIVVKENTMNKPQFDFNKTYTQLKPYIDTVFISESNDTCISIVCKYKKISGIMFEKAEYKIDATNYLPIKLQLYMYSNNDSYNGRLKNNNAIMATEYNNWKISGFDNNSLEFSFDKYAIKKGEKWVGINAFKNYKITVLN